MAYPALFSPQQLRQLDDVVRSILREETAGLKQKVGSLEEGFTSLKQDVKTIKAIQGDQSIRLQSMQVDISGLKSAYRGQSVLLEDLNHQFIGLAEVVDESLDQRNQVREHEDRLSSLETTQTLLTSTVTEHSKQLRKV